MDSRHRFTLSWPAQPFWAWAPVYVRYNRWGRKGTWTKLLAAVADGPDLECLMVDGSVVHVHQHGAGQKKTATGRGDGQVTGRAKH